MTSAELRRIVGAMTYSGTWFARKQFLSRVPDDTGMGATLHTNHIGVMADRDDATAIATLANHAAALVALLEACEAVQDAEKPNGAIPYVHRVAMAKDRVLTALAAVHATKAP